MPITFDEAIAVGAKVHDRFVSAGINPVLGARGSFAWADLVQFVMREADMVAAERGEGVVDAAIAAEEVTL
jgi:hypothetical protein